MLGRTTLSHLREMPLWITPAREREWIRAMLSECQHLSNRNARLSWLGACFGTAVLFRLRDPWSHFAGTSLLFAAVMVTLDWGTNSAALSVTLICMSSFTLALLWPVRAVRAALLGGGVLPTAHAIADLWQPLWPAYQYRPLDGFDWLILISVLLPSILFAAIGERLRRSLKLVS